MTASTFGKRGATITPSRVVSQPRATVSPAISASKQTPSLDADTPAYRHAPDEAGSPPAWAAVTASQLIKAVLIFVGLFALGAYFQGPHLMRDLRLAKTYEIDFSVNVNRGDCTGYVFMHFCEVSFTTENNGVTATENTHFFVTGFSMDKQPLIPVRSTVEPTAISVAYAVDDGLSNRLWSAIGWSFVFLACMMTAFFKLIVGRYKGGRADVWS
jgi:hypothetical protein